MKRKLTLLLCAVGCAAAITTMAGCANSEMTNDVTLTNITRSIESYSTGTYKQSMTIGDLKTVYNIDSGDVMQFVAKYQDTQGGAAIVMIEATSDDAARRIEKSLNNFVATLNRDMDTVVRHGNYVALFSDANDEKMAAAFSEFIVAK